MAIIIPFKTPDWYQLKITLKNANPPIWREFLVPSNILLPDLHKVIQTIMGWTNSYLNQFVSGKKIYCDPSNNLDLPTVDYREIVLSQILLSEKSSIQYEYDFEEGWQHTIVLEMILKNHTQVYPSCLKGNKCGPPEDCGGPFAYTEIVKIISDEMKKAEKNKEFQELLEWLPDDFDPDYFDIEEINEILQEEDYGCLTWD